MKAARRDRLCFPLPPTPTSSALPRGDSKMRLMRRTCAIASWINVTEESRHDANITEFFSVVVKPACNYLVVCSVHVSFSSTSVHSTLVWLWP